MKVQIGYGQVDPSAKPDGSPTSPNKQPWNALDGLKVDGLTVMNVATLEHNQGILDGAQAHLPNDPENYPWGFWSLDTSDDEGVFSRPPTLDIRFSLNHKAPGLTFLFYPYSDDWATSVRVAWYNSAGSVIQSGTYSISGIEGFVDQPVSGFRRIVVEFLSTNIRNRYIKLAGIQYGQGRSFPDDSIDSASVLEEVDPTSNEVTINTFNFRIRTHNPEFSIVSGVGDDMLMRNQMLTIVADGTDFGTYFLKFPWKDLHGDGSVVEFQAVDPIGAMDQYQFWGDIYANKPIESIVSQLFTICFPTQLIRYEIDAAFSGAVVSGWIPTCTCREALQLICFAIGAVADDSRRDYVWIYPPDTDVSYIMPDIKMYKGPLIEPTTYYNGVDVVAHEYTRGAEILQAHDGIVEVGRYTIKFNEPLHSLTVSGATLAQSSANHAVLNVPTTGTVKVSGKRFVANQTVFSVRGEVVAGEVENVMIYDGCTLLSPSQAPGRARALFHYLTQRTRITADVRLDKEGDAEDIAYLEAGEIVQAPTIGNPITGTIEQLDINLRGGRAKARVTGDVANAGHR